LAAACVRMLASVPCRVPMRPSPEQAPPHSPPPPPPGAATVLPRALQRQAPAITAAPRTLYASCCVLVSGSGGPRAHTTARWCCAAAARPSAPAGTGPARVRRAHVLTCRVRVWGRVHVRWQEAAARCLQQCSSAHPPPQYTHTHAHREHAPPPPALTRRHERHRRARQRHHSQLPPRQRVQPQQLRQGTRR
jgi:hypothetical protein